MFDQREAAARRRAVDHESHAHAAKKTRGAVAQSQYLRSCVCHFATLSNLDSLPPPSWSQTLTDTSPARRCLMKRVSIALPLAFVAGDEPDELVAWPIRSVDCTKPSRCQHIRFPKGGFHEDRCSVRPGGRGAFVADRPGGLRRRSDGRGDADFAGRVHPARD